MWIFSNFNHNLGKSFNFTIIRWNSNPTLFIWLSSSLICEIHMSISTQGSVILLKGDIVCICEKWQDIYPEWAWTKVKSVLIYNYCNKIIVTVISVLKMYRTCYNVNYYAFICLLEKIMFIHMHFWDLKAYSVDQWCSVKQLVELCITSPVCTCLPMCVLMRVHIADKTGTHSQCSNPFVKSIFLLSTLFVINTWDDVIVFLDPFWRCGSVGSETSALVSVQSSSHQQPRQQRLHHTQQTLHLQ